MRLRQLFIAVTFLMVSAPLSLSAATIRAYVTEFSVIGVPNKDELKTTLQGILASRLDQRQLQLVGSSEKADLLLSGSYALIGKMFSLDMQIQDPATGLITKVYEQGEGQDDLIPSLGRLARKVDQAVAARQATNAVPLLQSTATATPVAANLPTPGTGVKNDPPERGKYIVRRDSANPVNTGGWASDPLKGHFSGIALGRTLPSGEREIFVSGDHSILYFRKGAELKQVAVIDIPIPAKILAIDTADLDQDSIPEIYVTIMDREILASRVYQPKDTGFVLVAENLPWFLRGMGNDLKSRVIYAQKMTTGGEYSIGVERLVKAGNKFSASGTIKLPSPGNIFNFTCFRDKSGAEKMALLDGDGYLVVFSSDGSEVWKSSDKFGGSEANFKHETTAPGRIMGEQYDVHYLEQRITVLPNGTLIVPRNDGNFNVGANRNYNKHQLISLQWTGALFKEAWSTRQTPSYLADYAYDPAAQELVLLEVVQKASLFGSGNTVISINRLD